MRVVNKRSLVLVAFVVLAVFSTVQLYRVFELRFSSGDSYQPYSTYRSDPQGCRALYEALSDVNDLEVERNITPFEYFDLEEPFTLVLANVVRGPDPEAFIERLEGFVQKGGRLVLTFPPTDLSYTKHHGDCGHNHDDDDEEAEDTENASESSDEDPEKVSEHPADETRPGNGNDGAEKEHLEEGEKGEEPSDEASEGEEEKEKEAKEQEDEEDPFINMVDIEDRWGFSVDKLIFTEEQLQKDEVQVYGEWGLDASQNVFLNWRSPNVFELAEDHAWCVIASREDKPVILERIWGEGSIVLCADTYFLSNEGLLRDKPTDFLVWLFGKHQRLVFDETHLGVMDTRNVAEMLRDYQLHLVFITLLLIAVLFIWKSAVPLTPRHDEAYLQEGTQESIGQASSTALLALLKRSIPSKELVRHCGIIWHHDRAREPRFTATQLKEIELLSDEQDDTRHAVARYNRLADILRRRTSIETVPEGKEPTT